MVVPSSRLRMGSRVLTMLPSSADMKVPTPMVRRTHQRVLPMNASEGGGVGRRVIAIMRLQVWDYVAECDAGHWAGWLVCRFVGWSDRYVGWSAWAVESRLVPTDRL